MSFVPERFFNDVKYGSTRIQRAPVLEKGSNVPLSVFSAAARADMNSRAPANLCEASFGVATGLLRSGKAERSSRRDALGICTAFGDGVERSSNL